ncbi:MAG TPA: hypothetical protein VGC91_08115 [Pyrinomonadaceae bacterium]|jgi:hypothetical protein
MADALILESIRGVHLVLGAAPQREVTQEPALAEVWVGGGGASDLYGTGQKLGLSQIGQTFAAQYPLELDRDLRVYLRSLGADGAADCSQLRDAVSKLVPIQRETEAPVIGQATNAQNLLVEVGVDGFTRFARFRKVEIADNAGMTTNLRTTIYDSADFVNKELPRFINVTRASGSSALTQYVRVSHSSGGAYGAPSDVLAITFADAGGAGGSSGGFDPVPHGHQPIEP